jgi:hypothetical protein
LARGPFLISPKPAIVEVEVVVGDAARVGFESLTSVGMETLVGPPETISGRTVDGLVSFAAMAALEVRDARWT